MGTAYKYVTLLINKYLFKVYFTRESMLDDGCIMGTKPTQTLKDSIV